MYENYDEMISKVWKYVHLSPSHGNYGNLGLDDHAFIFPSCTKMT
jgi:hypothetical protein